MAYFDEGNRKTTEELRNFTVQGTPILENEMAVYFDITDPTLTPDNFTYMVMTATGQLPGEGSRMLAFFTLSADSPNTSLSITNDKTTLDYTLDLRSMRRMGVATGPAGLISVDWSSLTTNAMGNEFEPFQITEVVVAHYATMDVCGVEDNFLKLESLADEWYRKDITEGTSVSLGDLYIPGAGESDTEGDQDTSGRQMFQGIDDQGVWILALFCGSCANPAPWFITILHPCG
jgi:hypothetical protein